MKRSTDIFPNIWPRHLQFGVSFALVLLLASCIPSLEPTLQAPKFAVQGAGVEVLSFSPPLLGTGELVVRLPLTVTNPNPFALRLDRLDFDLLVNDRLALTSAFTDGFALAAQGSAPLVLDVTVPLSSGLELLADINALVRGRPTSYRWEGRTTVDVLDSVKVFAKATLDSGRIN